MTWTLSSRRSRSGTIDRWLDCEQEVLEKEVAKLFTPFLDERENPDGKMIRLVGVRIEKLEKFGVHKQAPLIESE